MARIALLVAVLALTVILLPAVVAEGEMGDADRLRLKKAIRNSGSLRVLGNIEHRTPEGRGEALVVGSGMQGGNRYQGGFEAWFPGKDELVLVSERTLPGFSIYLSDDGDVKNLVYEEDPPSIGELINDLGALLDTGRLEKWLGKSELKAEKAERTGVVRYAGLASRRLVPARTGGALGMGLDKILRIEVFIELDPRGALNQAEFRVVRADQLAAIKAAGIGGVRLGPNGQPLIPGGVKDQEGATSVYRMKWVSGAPGPRAKAFHTQAVKLLEEDR